MLELTAQAMMLAVAAVLVALGVWGGQYFMECDYVVYGVSVSTSGTACPYHSIALMKITHVAMFTHCPCLLSFYVNW